jgi:hypothetical protein
VKPDEDKLLTVPDAPPSAGPDRALDPAPPPAAGAPAPNPAPPATPLPGTKCLAVDEGDTASAMESAITAHSSAAATIHPLILFDSSRPTLGQRACLAVVTEADGSGEGAGRGVGAAPATPELPAIDAPDIALATGRAGMLSSGRVGSKSVMTALL